MQNLQIRSNDIKQFDDWPDLFQMMNRNTIRHVPDYGNQTAAIAPKSNTGGHVSCGVSPCETRQRMSINHRKFSDFPWKFFRQVISWSLVHFSIWRWLAYLPNSVYVLFSFRYISRQFWLVVVFILRRRLLLSLCEKKFFRQMISCDWLTFIENLSSCRT